MSLCSGVFAGSNTANTAKNSSSSWCRIACTGISNSFSPLVLPSDDSTNDEEDDKGNTGKADGAGGEYERCGRGACEPTGSSGNTGLGDQVDGWGDRDA
jgi:hypothetical protein